MFSRPQESSGTLRGPSGGPQGALRGPSGVKIPLRSKVCKNAYQIISTFTGEYGKHVFEASGALRDLQGALRRPLGGWQVKKMVVGISNSFYIVFSPYLAPLPNLIQIVQKTRKLVIFTFGRFWLVGLVDRKMVVGILNSFYVVFAPLLALILNFIQIGQKTQKLEIFTFGRFWLVGLVGRKIVVSI